MLSTGCLNRNVVKIPFYPHVLTRCGVVGGGGRVEIFFTSNLSTSIYTPSYLKLLMENFGIAERRLHCTPEGYHPTTFCRAIWEVQSRSLFCSTCTECSCMKGDFPCLRLVASHRLQYI